MDQYHDDSGSDGDSITLEIERGDAVIVYGCNERRYSPPVNHVTKVLIGSKDHTQPAGGITIFTNDLAPEVAHSGSTHHETSSPFGPFEDYGSKTQPVPKQYHELAEALSNLTASEQGKGNTHASPGLSRKFRNSNRSEVSALCKNPFLVDTIASNSVLPTGGSPGKILGASNSASASIGSYPGKDQIQSDTTPAPLSVGSGIDPPEAFQSPDLLSRDSTALASATCPSESLVASQAVQSVDKTPPDGSVSFQAIPPDITMQCRISNSSLSEAVQPVVSGAISPAPNLQVAPEATKIHILNAACSEELPPIQESLNTPYQSESSFHFPEPPRSPPLVCVPVKEVKFEEPPKHHVVKALDNVAEALGQIVPITVQPCHTTSTENHREETNVVVPPTYSTSQFQSNAKDDSNVPQTTSNKARNNNTESKMNTLKQGEIEIPSEQTDHEGNEHSYGIIGNEDNLSEITLPPLADSANNRDHDVGPYSNGHPRHRIRISIDQQSANPSKRTMAITVLLVVLLFSTAIILWVYKHFQRSSPN